MMKFKHYHLPTVSNQDLLKIVDREAALWTEDVTTRLQSYLGLSKAVAETHLSMQQVEVCCHLEILAGSTDDAQRHKRRRRRSEEDTNLSEGISCHTRWCILLHFTWSDPSFYCSLFQGTPCSKEVAASRIC